MENWAPRLRHHSQAVTVNCASSFSRWSLAMPPVSADGTPNTLSLIRERGHGSELLRPVMILEPR